MYDLDARSLHVLELIVNRYLTTGNPVSSKAISEIVGLSSATIRNVMASLEDAGFLFSSHTSAGRIPTTVGVNMFLGKMVEAFREKQHDDVCDEISGWCTVANTRDSIFETAAERLSDATNSVVISVYQKDDVFVEHAEIRKISNDRLLLITVLSDGNVKSSIFRSHCNVSMKDVTVATECLNEIMQGKSIYDVAKLVQQHIVLSRSKYGYSTALLLKDALQSDLAENAENYFIIKGHTNIFNNVETIEQLNTAKKMVTSDEIKNIFCDAVNDLKRSAKNEIFVGEDVLKAGFALALSPCFGYNGNVVGAVGVVCHPKTDYQKMLPIISFTARVLSSL